MPRPVKARSKALTEMSASSAATDPVLSPSRHLLAERRLGGRSVIGRDRHAHAGSMEPGHRVVGQRRRDPRTARWKSGTGRGSRRAHAAAPRGRDLPPCSRRGQSAGPRRRGLRARARRAPPRRHVRSGQPGLAGGHERDGVRWRRPGPASGPARSKPTTGGPKSPAVRASAALAAGGCDRMAVTISPTRGASGPSRSGRPTPAATASMTRSTESPRSRWSRGAQRISAYRTPSAARSATSSPATRSRAGAVCSREIGRSKKVSSSAWFAQRSGPIIRAVAASSGEVDPGFRGQLDRRRGTHGSVEVLVQLGLRQPPQPSLVGPRHHRRMIGTRAVASGAITLVLRRHWSRTGRAAAADPDRRRAGASRNGAAGPAMPADASLDRRPARAFDLARGAPAIVAGNGRRARPSCRRPIGPRAVVPATAADAVAAVARLSGILAAVNPAEAGPALGIGPAELPAIGAQLREAAPAATRSPASATRRRQP